MRSANASGELTIEKMKLGCKELFPKAGLAEDALVSAR